MVKATFHRLKVPDFGQRFKNAAFGDKWESGDFEVKGVPKARFFLRFFPKGCTDEWKQDCGLFLCVRDFGGHSRVRLQYTCWFDRGTKARFGKKCDEHEFDAKNDAGGWERVTTQKELVDFVNGGPLSVCCSILPFKPIDAVEWTQRTAPLNVLEKIAANFDSAEFVDAAVRVQGKVFKVSKVIICSGSPVFRRMFADDTKEKKTGVVDIEKEDADVIELLLRFLYSGKVEGLKTAAARLLPVADCYEVLGLVEMCLESLLADVSVENVLSALKLAFAHDHQGDFKRELLAYARKNFKLVKQHPEWTPDFIRENAEIAHEIMN